ncbi:MAG: rRNA maturation RNase YbeY [Alphaproteobacteria bacterium]
MTHANLHIDISRHCKDWDIDDASIQSVVMAALRGFEVEETELSIVLADDAFVRDLNKRYRDKDKPTNVLSFPQDTPPPNNMLGDIVLAFETVEREAAEQDKGFAAHFTHLLVHGVLHLLGYDHISDDEAQEMEALEIEILDGLGVENPYTE